MKTAAEYPSEGVEALAHHLYFERQDWSQALNLWQLRRCTGSPPIELLLAMEHCRVELGHLAANTTLAPLDPCFDQDAPTNGWRGQYVGLIRQRAYDYLVAGDMRRAAQLVRLLAGVEPDIRGVYTAAISPVGVVESENFRPTGDSAVPLIFEPDSLSTGAAESLIARHAERRVLLAIRQYTHTGRSSLLADFYRHFADSARALGIEAAPLESHPSENDSLRFPEMLRDAIAEFRPDVIVVDDLLASGASAKPTLRSAILSILEGARADHGVKLVATYPDSWHDEIAPVIGTAAGLVDLIHVSYTGLLSSSRVSPRIASKIWCYPPPIADPRGPNAAPVERRLRASIAGRINWSNESRLIWWSEIGASDLPVDLHPTVAGRELSPAEYADMLSSYAVTINFTQRSNQVGILTGRTIEALIHGSLLLEQDSEDTPRFLKPYEHYVPFRTLPELRVRLRRVLEDAPLRRRITEAGSAWAKQYFGGQQYWARLFSRLYRSDAS